jgi:hypothetical protein
MWASVLLIALAIGCGTSDTLSEPEKFGGAFARFASFLVIALLFSYVAFRIARRSVRLANVVFIIVFTAFVSEQIFVAFVGPGGLFGRPVDAPPDKDHIAAFAGEADEYPELDNTGREKRVNNAQNSRTEESKAVDMPESAMAKVVSQALAQLRSKELQDADAKLSEVYGKGVGNVESLEELKGHVALVENWRSAAVASRDAYANLFADVETSLTKQGVTPVVAKKFIARMEAQFRTQEQAQIAELMLESADAQLEYLGFLRDHWGSWKFDAEKNCPILSAGVQGSLGKEYEKLADNFVSTGEAVETAQSDFMERSAQRIQDRRHMR